MVLTEVQLRTDGGRDSGAGDRDDHGLRGDEHGHGGTAGRAHWQRSFSVRHQPLPKHTHTRQGWPPDPSAL